MQNLSFAKPKRLVCFSWVELSINHHNLAYLVMFLYLMKGLGLIRRKTYVSCFGWMLCQMHKLESFNHTEEIETENIW